MVRPIHNSNKNNTFYNELIGVELMFAQLFKLIRNIKENLIQCKDMLFLKHSLQYIGEKCGLSLN